MSIVWLAPLGLAALGALLVPIAIHLLRRAEHRSTPFAAFRFLRAAGLPRRRIRIAEPALLLLRCALIGVVALMLAQPMLERPGSPRSVVAVVPPVSASAARALLDFGPDTYARWLSLGFSSLSSDQPRGTAATMSLLRELDAELPRGSRLDVVVPEVLAGLDAERPRLSREVGWHVVTGATPPARGPSANVTRRVVLHAAPDASARRFFAAAVESWRARGEVAELIDYVPDQALPSGATLVWLDGPLGDDAQRWLEAGGTALVAQDENGTGRVLLHDAGGTPLVRERAVGRGRLVAIAVVFSPAALPVLHDADFPQRLASWIDPPALAPHIARADSIEPMRGGSAPAPRGEPMAPWLGLLAALLFALERAWGSALRRRRLA